MARLRSIVIIFVFVFTPAIARAGEPLFPRPLHLTREIDDPVAGRITVDEYFFGSRAVSIANVTVIVDYAEGTLTRIDHAAGTFSVARLDEIGRATAFGPRRRRARAAVAGSLHEIGRDRRGGRDVVLYRAGEGADDPHVEIEIAIDRSIALTRSGAEVIAGAAWPAERTAEGDAILRASRGSTVSAVSTGPGAVDVSYGLPVETIITWSGEPGAGGTSAPHQGESVRLVNRVIRVGTERPPPEALDVPRGARRVDDPRIAAAALLGALDRTGAPDE